MGISRRDMVATYILLLCVVVIIASIVIGAFLYNYYMDKANSIVYHEENNFVGITVYYNISLNDYIATKIVNEEETPMEPILVVKSTVKYPIPPFVTVETVYIDENDPRSTTILNNIEKAYVALEGMLIAITTSAITIIACMIVDKVIDYTSKKNK